MSLRRGFALVELLVGLVLFGLIGGVMLTSLLALQRNVHAQLSRLSAEGALDAGVGFLGSELLRLGTDTAGSDIVQQAAESLTYRSERGTGLACRVTAAGVTLEAANFAGPRSPQPGRDSLFIYIGQDSLLGLPGGWVSAPLLAVRNGACGASPAWDLVTVIDTSRFPLRGQPTLVPIRLFEVMQVRLYRSSGATWLGARSVSAGELIQPLAGPFTLARSGFLLLDSLGAPSPSPVSTRQIGVRLSGPWSGWQRNGGAAPEESTSVMILPGNLRP
jgi:hypothetical protein